MTVVDIPLVKEKKRKSMSSSSSPEPEYSSSLFAPQENTQPQPLPDDTQWTHWNNSDNEDESHDAERHLALASARAGKTVASKQSSSQCLPNEILLQVFEYLLSDQGTLFSCSLVSLNWHRCATSYLYRYPRFTSTLHWALFIQTLCRSKITVRPKTRRRRSIIQNLSRSRQFSPHRPSQLAPAQIEVFGGQPKWRNDRLLTDLGRYVHGIDLSKRPIHVQESTQNSCCASDIKCKHRNGSAANPVQDTGVSSRRISRLVRLPSNSNSTTTQPQQARRPTIDLTSPYYGVDDDDFEEDETESSESPSPNATHPQRNLNPETSLNGTRRTILYRGVGSGRRVPWFATSTSSTSSSSLLFSSVSGSQGSNEENNSPSTAADITITFKRQITITVSSLIELTRHCPNLEVLSIVSAQLVLDTLNVETGDYQSTTQPGPHTGLTFVSVTTKDAIKAISENCPKLQQLSLAGCDWLTTDEVMSLVTRCRQLYNLDLSRCGKLDGRLSKHLVVREMVPREFFDSAGMSLAEAGIRALGGSVAYETAKRLSSISTTPPISMSDLDVPLSDLVGMPWTPKAAKGTPVDDYPYQYTGKVKVREGAMLDLVRSIINDPSRTSNNSSQANSSSSSSQESQPPTFDSSSSSSSDAHAHTQLTQQWQLQYNQQQLQQLQHHYRFHREQTQQENHPLSFFELLSATLEDGSQQTDEGASVGESSSSHHHTHNQDTLTYTHAQLGDIAESGDWGNTLLVVGSANDSNYNNEQDRPQEELFEL
ncbi:hypothetical protein BG005_004734 [Podila minutissima]|nr:hypothetical protein BG005_004734 [Podila minutissima]